MSFWEPYKPVSKKSVEHFASVVKTVYRTMMEACGDTAAIRDEGGIHNSAWKILKQAAKNENPAELAAYIYLEFATRHYFFDGNKRTAHMIAKMFLMFRAIHLKVNYKDATRFIIEIGAGKKTQSEIVKWIRDNSEEYDTKAQFENVWDAWFNDIWNKEK